MSAIKVENLKNLVTKSGLSIAAAERKAGLSRNAIQNLLYGKSKTASKETLEAICYALDCSPKDIAEDIPTSFKKGAMWNEDLFIKVIKATSAELERQSLIPYFEEITPIFQDAYMYLIHSSEKEIDKNFITWLIKKHFN